ncbi:MAG: hypothetical protein K8T89_16950 [Planctomycetes bacterium]|nr:hypothetical protein [Planctomycetota bacterium]
MLRYVGDATLTTDLKLTAEQVRKLTNYRQKVWDEVYSTRPADRAKINEARSKATEAVIKDILTPAQYERTRQISARIVTTVSAFPKGAKKDSSTVSARVLVTYPELVEIINLNEDQKKILGQQPGTVFGTASYSTITLSAEQAAALEKFMGDPPAQPLVATTDPRLQQGVGPTPSDVTLLRVKDIQDELKLTEVQAKLFTNISQGWTDLGRITSSEFSQKEISEKYLDVQAETVKFFTADLKAEQSIRLTQLKNQRLQSTFTRDAFYLRPEIVKSLAISDPQQKQLEAVAASWEAEVVKAFETDQSYEATKKSVDAANAARTENAVAVLTPEQAKKDKELVGPPYAGNYPVVQPRPTFPGAESNPRGGDSRTNSLRIMLEASFGKYMLDLTHIARNPDVQAELKMTQEAIQKAQAAYTKMLTASRSAFSSSANAEIVASQAEARSVAIEKAITEILTADQRKRLRQIVLQIMEGPNTLTSIYSRYGAAAYPGVAEEIKLTPEQKAKLFGGTKPADVLSDMQKSAIKDMLGEPYKGRTTTTPGSGAGGPGGGFGGGSRASSGDSAPSIPARVRLITGNRLDEPLKVTPEQKKKIADVYTSYLANREQVIDDYRPGSAALSKALAATIEKFEKEVAAALSPEQAKRLDQLLIQSEAADSLSGTLNQAAISKKLELTPDQVLKITAAAQDGEQTASLLVSVKLPEPKITALSATLRNRTDSHILAVLSDSQQKAWKEMTGESAGFSKQNLGPRRVVGPSSKR